MAGGRVRPVVLVRAAGCACPVPDVVARGAVWVCERCQVAVRQSGTSKEVEQGIGARCHYCLRPGGPEGVELTKDHIVPRSLLAAGQGDGTRNIVLACYSCNHKKGSARSSCVCARCRWAWRKWGPPGWETWSTWSPKAVYTERSA